MNNILLIPENTKQRSGGAHLLPSRADNLFTRIIRDPSGGSGFLRERQCTEMLAGLLINAPTVCNKICHSLAKFTEFPLDIIDDCDFSINTEQPIGRKRDDLRIEGWPKNGDRAKRIVLWTIEVKVGSFFHMSSDAKQTSEEAEERSELVNQLKNYDDWLVGQGDVAHRAGIVLAVKDLMDEISKEELVASWKCITWTGLGAVLRDALLDQNVNLPVEERILCRHVLGFIVAHLWRSAEMPDARFEFEDVAMLRAWSMMVNDCEQKIENLVNPLKEIMDAFPLGKRTCSQNSLFAEYGRCAKGRTLVVDNDAYPTLCTLWAGVVMDRGGDGADFFVWIESRSRSPYKSVAHSIYEKLHSLNSSWSTEEGWWDAWLYLPLTGLISLSAKEQQRKVQEFVRGALDDLVNAGLEKALKEAEKKKSVLSG